nr:MAG TPA: hypothetical protein [Caudoviricetes sp.]
MLNTIEELSNLIENDPTFGGCAVELPSGKIIGTTSGGWQPLLYQNYEDDEPVNITWDKALILYNEEIG